MTNKKKKKPEEKKEKKCKKKIHTGMTIWKSFWRHIIAVAVQKKTKRKVLFNFFV